MVAIGDNGKGMTEATLVQAMRPGSTSPSEARSADDLGRFGAGTQDGVLFSVPATHGHDQDKAAGIHTRRWELDTVVASHQWRLLRGYPDECADFAERLEAQAQGTVVIWQETGPAS